MKRNCVQDFVAVSVGGVCAGAVEQTPFQMQVPRSSLNGHLNLLFPPQSPATVGYEWTLQTS